jgi:hypothetical protein
MKFAHGYSYVVFMKKTLVFWPHKLDTYANSFQAKIREGVKSKNEEEEIGRNIHHSRP